jgi:glycosyltransferase involved in cell wall biosynthesis
MKITVTGHSLIHPRQHMLFSHMADVDLAEVQVISPSRWESEQCTPVNLQDYRHVCLESLGTSFLSYRLRGVEEAISGFNPDILYVMEEPFTPFALHCSKIAEEHGIPMAVFTWENVLDRSFGERNNKIEQEVVAKATILVAGNEGAKKRLIHKGADEDKIAVCPQTGINCELFKPMPDVEKTQDVGYFGRMVKEKGVEYIEKAVKDLGLKMLWVGGRGDITPSYGDYVPWADYLKMPEYYNKTKLFVTYPNSFNGFHEQLNYSIPESMACGTPVVSSNNGSIAEMGA